MSVRAKDRLGALLLLGFVGVLWFQRDYLTPFGGIFPDRVMIIMACLLVIDILLSFTPYASLKENEGNNQPGSESHILRTVVVIVSIFLWLGLIKYLGFVIGSIISFSGISWYLAKEKRKMTTLLTSIILSVVLVAMIVVVFEKILLVPLPKGEWLIRFL